LKEQQQWEKIEMRYSREEEEMKRKDVLRRLNNLLPDRYEENRRSEEIARKEDERRKDFELLQFHSEFMEREIKRDPYYYGREPVSL